MAGKSLLKIIAGRAEDFIEIGDYSFYAAPWTLEENAEYEQLDDDLTYSSKAAALLKQAWRSSGASREEVNAAEQAQGAFELARNTFLASELRKRMRTPNADAAVIDAVWVRKNLFAAKLGVVLYVLTWGELPKPATDGQNTKAR